MVILIDVRWSGLQIFTVLNRQKLQTGTSRAQFSSILRQNLSPLLHPTISKCLLRIPKCPTPHPSPFSSPSRCSSPCCSFPLFIHFHLLRIYVHCCSPLCNWLYSIPDCLQSCCKHSWRQRCHQLIHLHCHLLRRGAVQEFARARVEQVVLEQCCVQRSERPLAVQAAVQVLHSCLAILPSPSSHTLPFPSCS